MPEINTGNVPNIDTAPLTPQAPVAQPQVTAPQVPEPVVTTPAPQVNPVQDRTREQFEKLLENNAKLFEANENLRKELEAREIAKETFNPIQQPPVQTPVTQPSVDPMDFIKTDPITGDRYIDDVALKAKIDEVNQSASRAEAAVREYTKTAKEKEQAAEQREIERQEREAYQAYPELNPNAKETFDKTFANNTRALIYDSLVNPQDYNGKSLDFKEAATIVREQYQGKKTVQETLDEGKTPEQLSEEARALKQEASASANGQQPSERTNEAEDASLESLRLATRKGNLDAIAQRIFAIEQNAINDQS
jgi:hypothetical protein